MNGWRTAHGWSPSNRRGFPPSTPAFRVEWTRRYFSIYRPRTGRRFSARTRSGSWCGVSVTDLHFAGGCPIRHDGRQLLPAHHPQSASTVDVCGRLGVLLLLPPAAVVVRAEPLLPVGAVFPVNRRFLSIAAAIYSLRDARRWVRIIWAALTGYPAVCAALTLAFRGIRVAVQQGSRADGIIGVPGRLLPGDRCSESPVQGNIRADPNIDGTGRSTDRRAHPGNWIGIGSCQLRAVLFETGVTSYNGVQIYPSRQMWRDADPVGRYESVWNRDAYVTWVPADGEPVLTNPRRTWWWEPLTPAAPSRVSTSAT